mmetsp:Transcript_90992/g.136302  ORF Transcript_90992/g.136302 Transcript_90992/m.136302 type:complete len:390 (-) Transcript_90992:187-1356(-)
MDPQTKQTRDVLQFAIAGFEKCGTTSLMRDVFGKSERVFIPDKEVHLLEKNDTTSFIALYQDKGNRKTKNGKSIINGFKSPGVLKRGDSLRALSTFFPDTKFIVTMKHPVLWFQSWYNFKVRQGIFGDDPPSPEETRGFCGEICANTATETPPGCVGAEYKRKYGGLCAGYGNFHIYLSRLGFTPMNTSDELELLGFLPTHFPFPTAKLLLMEINQFDTDSSVAMTAAREMEDFVELDRGSLAGSFPTKQSHKYDLAICDEKHAPTREYLLEIGARSAEWIERYLLKSPQVTAISRTDFVKRIRQWKIDPCIGNDASTSPPRSFNRGNKDLTIHLSDTLQLDVPNFTHFWYGLFLGFFAAGVLAFCYSSFQKHRRRQREKTDKTFAHDD